MADEQAVWERSGHADFSLRVLSTAVAYLAQAGTDESMLTTLVKLAWPSKDNGAATALVAYIRKNSVWGCATAACLLGQPHRPIG